MADKAFRRPAIPAAPSRWLTLEFLGVWGLKLSSWGFQLAALGISDDVSPSADCFFECQALVFTAPTCNASGAGVMTATRFLQDIPQSRSSAAVLAHRVA